jgi:UDP-N-acetylmuramyl pentapeptide phosphotransferase/UDP-N-acetylglucosamine-1-phosphate transferase
MQSILVFFTSLFFVVFAVPQIIDIAFKKHLFDDPVESRKVHKNVIPNFGGIALFFAVLFTCTLFIPPATVPEANTIIAAGLILFLTGLKDDILVLGPLVKFMAQLLGAVVLIVAGGFRIDNLQGILGIYEIPQAASLLLSLLFIVGVVNAFNLIDGIDGLAGTLASIAMFMFAFLFYETAEPGWSWLALSVAGALLGFLYYNFTPAKIFMGDSGSLFIGLLAAVFSIKFMNSTYVPDAGHAGFAITSKVSLLSAILVVPIFDTLRVFTLRIMKGTSPFTADNNHLHHRLLSLALNHIQATAILSGFNLLLIIMACSFQRLGDNLILTILIITTLIGNEVLSFLSGRYRKILAKNMQAKDPVFGVYEEASSHNGQKLLQKISEI